MRYETYAVSENYLYPIVTHPLFYTNKSNTWSYYDHDKEPPYYRKRQFGIETFKSIPIFEIFGPDFIRVSKEDKEKHIKDVIIPSLKLVKNICNYYKAPKAYGIILLYLTGLSNVEGV